MFFLQGAKEPPRSGNLMIFDVKIGNHRVSHFQLYTLLGGRGCDPSLSQLTSPKSPVSGCAGSAGFAVDCRFALSLLRSRLPTL